jgi:hypothetical protein
VPHGLEPCPFKASGPRFTGVDSQLWQFTWAIVK